ncbi:MAG: cbb3-type cytochrome c oxidase subunit I [Rhizobiales bacterium]|nr:cbb3-type cytochrome c oxidase subunit I [Hyphomicrobiales bacterium]
MREREDHRKTTAIVYAYVVACAVWLVLGSAYGAVLAWKLVYPDALPLEWLSYGRIRPVHTASLLLGFLSLGLTGLAYLVVNRTAERPIWSPMLACAALVFWNGALVAGLVTLSLGVTRGPIEYREWIAPVAMLFAIGAVLNGLNILITLIRRTTPELYISNWFILAGFACLPVLYLVAYLPDFAAGSANIIIQGYYMHVVLGLWFTPLILGITYWALPILLNKPIYSYGLGVLAFWGNLVFYSLIGAHHFIFAPTAWWLQSTAILVGLGMMVPVWASTGNFLLTMRGSWRYVRHEPAGWFLLSGALMYGLASSQGTLQAFRPVNLLVHFTNYTVGHAHFAAYGFVSFLLFGAIYALLPRLTRRDCPRAFVVTHFWLALIGLGLYVLAMTIAGVWQGLSWASGVAFIDSVVAIAPWYLLRAIGGSLMAASHLVFAWNLWLMRPKAVRAPVLAAQGAPA